MRLFLLRGDAQIKAHHVTKLTVNLHAKLIVRGNAI